MTELSKHWRRYMWPLGILGILAISILLWQLPFPSNVLVCGLAFTLGGVRIRTEQLRWRVDQLDRWRETELKIEQELAERTRRKTDAVHH